MRIPLALGLVSVLVIPSLAGAQERTLLASAERLAAESELQHVESSGPSATRMGIALGLVAAGVAMTLIDPTQPAQPTQPGTVDLQDYLGPGRYRLIHQRGDEYGARWTCNYDRCWTSNEQLQENYKAGYTDGADDGLYYGLVQGYADGQQSMIRVIDATGSVVYEGPFKPFVPWKKRSPAFKYGGAAMAAAGAVVALLWRDGPQVSAGPTAGGARASVTIGF